MTRRLPDKATGQGCHSMELRGPDLYPTPAPLTRALLSIISIDPHDGPIWEPAAGRADMARIIADGGYDCIATDKHDYGVPDQVLIGHDFFEQSGPPQLEDQKCKTIITNPPFSHAAEFVRHGLTLCENVFVLARLGFLEGKARSDILDEHLHAVYPFRERPPMMHRWVLDPVTNQYVEWQGKKAESAIPFAWFFFSKTPLLFQDTKMKRISWREHIK